MSAAVLDTLAPAETVALLCNGRLNGAFEAAAKAHAIGLRDRSAQRWPNDTWALYERRAGQWVPL